VDGHSWRHVMLRLLACRAASLAPAVISLERSRAVRGTYDCRALPACPTAAEHEDDRRMKGEADG
jgi:hypothetical protein